MFQIDKPMTPFLAETLEVLLRWLVVKFVRKNVLAKVSTCGALIKIDPCKKNNQKQISDVNLGFAVNQEIRSPKQVNRRVNGGMIFQFKKEAVAFLSTICSHLMKKSPVNSYFA